VFSVRYGLNLYIYYVDGLENVTFLVCPCGGESEYFHRSPASCTR
jgi:hypothetical protein